ncbi:MAG TPA: DUF1116 domain-containing protein [Candidatus Dormibacteraeota bacterium]|nr:DUF1116 domain-containing protein [Candidatus Dormibacteraeota bacterium]
MPQGEGKPTPVALPSEVGVVNVGLGVLGESVRAQGAPAVDLDWRIPAGGRADLVAALTRLHGRWGSQVEQANREVVRRLEESVPVLVGVSRLAEAVPEADGRVLLHPGPPLAWADVCAPLRRSARAAAVAQGWAGSPEEAEALIGRGAVRLEPANHHATVVPMATVVGPLDPVFVVENRPGGNRSCAPLNQGPGEAPWLGVDSPEAIRRLIWLREVAGPALAEAIRSAGPIDLFALVAQGLQMGDDVHIRSQATTNLLLRALLPHLVTGRHPGMPELARFLSWNHLFFLNLAMAAAKATVDWAAQVEGSSVVVGMARNGTTFGVRLGGFEGWFTAPAPPVGNALYQPGYGPEDGAPDIGDSAVLELVGLGGAAAAASPAVASFLGGIAGAFEATATFGSICVARSGRFKLPFLDFQGSPVGVDARRVVELEVAPMIDTGILHAAEPQGQIGAGVARAPLDCFRQAVLALDRRLAAGEGRDRPPGP